MLVVAFVYIWMPIKMTMRKRLESSASIIGNSWVTFTSSGVVDPVFSVIISAKRSNRTLTKKRKKREYGKRITKKDRGGTNNKNRSVDPM